LAILISIVSHFTFTYHHLEYTVNEEVLPLAISIQFVVVFLYFQYDVVIDPSLHGVIYAPLKLSLHMEVTKLSFQL